MSDSRYQKEKQMFLKQFHSLTQNRSRYQVFTDIISCGAFALHNAVNKVKAYEEEYRTIMQSYSQIERKILGVLFARIISMLEYNGLPYDVLGELYMQLELNDKKQGVVLTPFPLAELMSALFFDEQLQV